MATSLGQRVFRSQVAAQVGGSWLRSGDYPRHEVASSSFRDALGGGRAVTVTFGGREGAPRLAYLFKLYDERPYGTVQVTVTNDTGREIRIEALRSLDAVGDPILDLGARDGADRVLSDSFSEDWPTLALYDLGQGPRRMHRQGAKENASAGDCLQPLEQVIDRDKLLVRTNVHDFAYAAARKSHRQ